MSAVHVAVLATLAAVLTALTALSGLLLPTLMLFTRLALSALLLAGLALPTLLRIALRVLRVARVLLVRHFDVLHGVSEAPRPRRRITPEPWSGSYRRRHQSHQTSVK
jgi:hypothetical protein